MDVFELRERLVGREGAYSRFVRSFIRIRDERIRAHVEEELDRGLLWPEPLVQLNPTFARGPLVDELIEEGVLHPECGRIFRRGKTHETAGEPIRFYRHQEEAIRRARAGRSYVLTTGTGSGKSLTYIVPIVDEVLRTGSGKGIRGIVVYPMNALANSQKGELEKFLVAGYPEGRPPVTFARYTGQEDQEERDRILADPPDILLTNYVMLELILTRTNERRLVGAASALRFLVLDELHTYRGRQGADVALLVRRLREFTGARDLLCVGTSATLATGGSAEDSRRTVARMASLLFGTGIAPGDVIGESLERFTRPTPADAPDARERLAAAVRAWAGESLPASAEDPDAFRDDRLAAWTETELGLAEEGDGPDRHLVRQKPRPIGGEDGAAARLSAATGISRETCERALRRILLAGYRLEHPETRFPVFAFRLHQFIGRGDTVHVSLDPPADRHVTVHAQQFVPGRRDAVLLPLAFCRECGQEYLVVLRTTDDETGGTIYLPRDLGDRARDERGQAGFLVDAETVDWPEEAAAQAERLPDNWVEERDGRLQVRDHYRQYLPRKVRVGADGRESAAGREFWWFPAPLSVCLHCGVAYADRRQGDFARLGTLSSEGRSTATTVLALATVLALRREETLPGRARKLLSFTDNRQDASLQAGHFNDFVETILLRGAIYRAAARAGEEGLRHDEIALRVFAALDLPFEAYAANPGARFGPRDDTNRALRELLGYRIYRDLKRGWRVNAPNLEQCGLLRIDYLSLDEIARADDLWQNRHPALADAAPETREEVARALLDHLRRELAIDADALDPEYQERIRQQTRRLLNERWAIAEGDRLEHRAIAFPRSSRRDDWRGNIFLSPRGRFGRYLRGSRLLRGEDRVTDETVRQVLGDLFSVLAEAGLLKTVGEDAEGTPGYLLSAAALTWKAGDGRRPPADPVRVPHESREEDRPPNEFFVRLYREVAGELHGIEGREHTAQVPPDERQERERRFREGSLPVLFCSPTMELGVDISELNVVNLRNVPPSPANYAQRSGRAGRSGQPALVFTYCTKGSPHDQYYFRRPSLMVHGAVSPPRMDLANEDLVRSHVHATWLTESGLSLGSSMSELLDLDGRPPALTPVESVAGALRDEAARARARERARRVLAGIEEELRGSAWYDEEWLDRTLDAIPRSFDEACQRWRDLYRAAYLQQQRQHEILQSANTPAQARHLAKQLYLEATNQLTLLREPGRLTESDFYTYRYFASEGFLPGYSFPRLPLSAYIPGRREGRGGRQNFVSRPRFLAISEFGPRNLVYYEGAVYAIHRVLLPLSGDPDQDLALSHARVCLACGYLHPLRDVTAGPDVCEQCGARLEAQGTYRNLLRLQNVTTRLRQRITSDEEERVRRGYEVRTTFRFAEQPAARARATVEDEDGPVLELDYGHAATLCRMNLGWRRRREPGQYGFLLDVERGTWEREPDADEQASGDDPLGPRTARVVPYVQDTKNCLLLGIAGATGQGEEEGPEPAVLYSLAWALKQGIQAHFQLEDRELAIEPLPGEERPVRVLFYEAAEGGAGVLRQLLADPEALPAVAREALAICHFDPDTGEDRDRPEGARERCEAACYDCLLGYQNQRLHRLLDRFRCRDLLLRLARARVVVSPTARSRREHLDRLLARCESELEERFLHFLDDRELHLPSEAQWRCAECNTRADFYYAGSGAVIYVDGPHHRFADRAARDREQERCLEARGYLVIRFPAEEDWEALVREHADVFGTPAEPAEFPDRWREVVRRLEERGWEVRPAPAAGPAGPVLEVRRDGARVRVAAADTRGARAAEEDGVRVMRVDPAAPEEAVAAIGRALAGEEGR